MDEILLAGRDDQVPSEAESKEFALMGFGELTRAVEEHVTRTAGSRQS